MVGHVDQHAPITGVQYVSEFFYYFWTLPWIVLPATPAIVIGVWTGLDRYNSHVGKFLISWVAPFLILITLTAYKSKHYSFAVLPAFSVLAAYGTIVWMRSLKRPARAMPLLVAWFVGCAAVILWLKLSIIPRSDSNRDYVALARRANAIAPDDQPTHMIGLGEEPIAYYLDPIPNRIDNLADIPVDQTLHAVTRLDTVDALRAAHTVEVLIPKTKSKPTDNPLVFIKLN
jgi:hypothetical protein